MEGGLLLDVVVQRDTSVFELFASEDEALLVWGNAGGMSNSPSLLLLQVSGLVKFFKVL